MLVLLTAIIFLFLHIFKCNNTQATIILNKKHAVSTCLTSTIYDAYFLNWTDYTNHYTVVQKEVLKSSLIFLFLYKNNNGIVSAIACHSLYILFERINIVSAVNFGKQIYSEHLRVFGKKGVKMRTQTALRNWDEKRIISKTTLI